MWKPRRKSSRETDFNNGLLLRRSTSNVNFIRSSLKDVENLLANDDVDSYGFNETLGLPSPCSTAVNARRLSIFHRVHLANKFARAFSVKQTPSPEKTSPESNDAAPVEKLSKPDRTISFPASFSPESNNDVTTADKLLKSDRLISFPANNPLESNNDVTAMEILIKSDRTISFPAKSSPESNNVTAETLTKADREISIPATTTEKSVKSDRTNTVPAIYSPESNNDVTAADKLDNLTEKLTKSDREISIPANTTEKLTNSDRRITFPAVSSPESNNDVKAEEISTKSTKADRTVTIPGASNNRVVIYTTSLRVVRPTFEACRTVQSILRGFRISIDERDLSMDSTFLHELQNLMSNNNNNNDVVSTENSEKTKLTLPRVFIGGRYIGGAEEVKELHESGELKKIVDGLPAVNAAVCDGCGDVRFVLCDECNGSHKCYTEKGGFRSCTLCNENGLVRCPSCLGC